MDRDILFRGQKKILNANEHDVWAYGDLRHGHNSDRIYINSGPYQTYEVAPETAGQYAGLTDKNGKRIFDGDIVKKMVKIYPLGKNEPVGERMLVGVVICERDGINPECWLIESKDEHGNRTKYIFDNSYEIIGNIHDNPELLEVE